MQFRRSGDPSRALLYLNHAVGVAPPEDPTSHVLRCQCNIRLGKYSDANLDADEILRMSATNVKGVMCKAEAQYNMGRFEHALMYFYRYVLAGKAILRIVVYPNPQGECNSQRISRRAVWHQEVPRRDPELALPFEGIQL